MNWLDTQTKEILRKEPDPKLAPPKVAEFALVLLRKGTDRRRLIRAICRINMCKESSAEVLADRPAPVTINADLTEGEALFGQFELICCDAISAFIRSEVLEQSDESYVRSLFQRILNSPEFKPALVKVIAVPANESGQRFADQFLGEVTPGYQKRNARFSVRVPVKKARIMSHWARRLGARIHCEDVAPK